MSEVLRSLVIDNWYKAVLAIGAVVFVIALTVPLQVPNRVVLSAALGAVLHGLGQWINHPYQERIGPGFKIFGHTRKPSIPGVALELIGIALMCWGGWRLLAV